LVAVPSDLVFSRPPTVVKKVVGVFVRFSCAASRLSH
jgi:hypothetical protein